MSKLRQDLQRDGEIEDITHALTPLLIESGPSTQRNADLVRRHAEGLAREIQSDVMAKEDEIADAIEQGIRRFARREWQVSR